MGVGEIVLVSIWVAGCGMAMGYLVRQLRYGWADPFFVLVAIGVFYPMAKLMQTLEVGPSLARSYLADIAIIPAVAVFAAAMNLKGGRIGLLRQRWPVIIFTGVITLYEVWQFAVENTAFGRESHTRGDPWDLVIFAVMFVVTKVLTILSNRRIRARLGRGD